jgi:hypothetical protein
MIFKKYLTMSSLTLAYIGRNELFSFANLDNRMNNCRTIEEGHSERSFWNSGHNT